ncbi:tyrosine-protein phosphatase [Caenimonas terrae]|uniref:Tyrosine-protein phosphatase n=1 Tax=Caenimonas terrae TaxID=696074 RepID=A0ABW0NIZ0_9BURK
MTSSFNLTGAPNFRDLGGYQTADGKETVRRHHLFRSDHLGNLEAEDIQLLSGKLREPVRVLDLRGVTERETAVCALEGVTVHSLSIEPTIVQVLSDLTDAGHKLTRADVVGHMQDTYRGFVRQNTHRFASLFGFLLESSDPLVFHCTAGKDRTGFAAALILLALGVSREDVMGDYLLTNQRLKPKSEWKGLTPDVASVLYRVQPEFLDAAFDAVQQKYGGLEAYFREGLGVREAERARLRELYLQRK